MQPVSRCALVFVLALAACTVGPATGPFFPGTPEADEAAIRNLLGEIQAKFNSGDLDAFMPIFTDDAVVMAPETPDVVGSEAIRAMYATSLAQVDMKVEFFTEEVEVAGDLAYEKGTYSLQVSDKATGQFLTASRNRHIHVFRRQADGTWKTWRMMVNSPEAATTP